MLSLASGKYSHEEVRKVLHGIYGPRVVRYRYDLISDDGYNLGEIDGVLECQIEVNSMNSKSKRTAKFKLKDTMDIDFLRDRIQPWMEVQMPDGGWASFPLGVFLLSTPKRVDSSSRMKVREISAYDGLQILVDAKFTERYAVSEGTNYVQAVLNILEMAGITDTNIAPTNLTLPTAREWGPGVEYLTAINDLLTAINYRSLYVDPYGTFTSYEFVPPYVRAAEYVYADDEESIIHYGVEDELDLYDVPNVFIGMVSEPDRPEMVYVYKNMNPSSPTSVVARGREIVAPPQKFDAADQATLEALVKRWAFEASQVYRKVTFETANMPHHDVDDVYWITYSNLGVYMKVHELSWSMDLRVGGRMKHQVREVTPI